MYDSSTAKNTNKVLGRNIQILPNVCYKSTAILSSWSLSYRHVKIQLVNEDILHTLIDVLLTVFFTIWSLHLRISQVELGTQNEYFYDFTLKARVVCSASECLNYTYKSDNPQESDSP